MPSLPSQGSSTLVKQLGTAGNYIPVSAPPIFAAVISAWTSATPGVGLLQQTYSVPSVGTVTVVGAVNSQAHFTLTLDGTNYLDLNDAVDQTPNALYVATIPVAQGDLVNLSVSAATGVIARLFFTPSA